MAILWWIIQCLMVLIKTSKDVYDAFEKVSPFSEELLTKINDFKYKEKID